MKDWTCINCSWINAGSWCSNCGTSNRATEPRNVAKVVVRPVSNTGPIETPFRKRGANKRPIVQVQTWPNGEAWG